MAMIRPCTRDDFPALSGLMAYSFGGPTTVEDLERAEASMPPGMVRYRWVAVVDVRTVGFVAISRAKGSKPGWFAFRISVEPAARRQGIGGSLAATALSRLKDLGATEIRALSREGELDSERFARAHRFELKSHVFESWMDPSGFDSSGVRSDLSHPGISIIDYGQTAMDRADQRALFDIHSTCSIDVPGAHGEPQFEDFCHMYLNAPSFDPAGTFLAVQNGRWIGISSIGRMSDGRWFNTITGVRREARGRGVALALKLAVIEYARVKGITELRTNNDSTNAPMLAINEKLGYQRLPGWLVWDRRLDEGAANVE